MKKLVLTDFHKVEVVEAPIPVPGRGQAVVRVKYAGICGSDLHVFSGLHPTAKPPLVMGHEACGELYAIDSGRTDVKVGDKVCVHTVEPCNACEGCCAGRENLCTSVKILGTSLDGVFTQYMLVNADRVIRFGGGVDDKVAALVEPLTVGVHDLRRSGFRAGEDVLIREATRMEIARGMGFTVVDPGGEDFEAVCAENCGGMGFDRVFEITSVQSSFDTCVSRLKRGGALVQVGMPPAGKIFDLDINKIIYSECDLLGVRHHTMSDMQAAVKIIDSGVLDAQLRPLVSAIYPLDKSMEAFERARTDKSVLRVLIDLTA